MYIYIYIYVYIYIYLYISVLAGYMSRGAWTKHRNPALAQHTTHKSVNVAFHFKT